MGGFHATLMPDEVKDYAEAVVVGEAEDLWPQVIDDARCGRLQPIYAPTASPTSARCVTTGRSFAAGAISPIGLVETGRGCRFPCDFCAVQTFFERTARHRPIDAIVAEIASLKAEKRLFFFVDDNFAADLAFARELAEALAPLDIRWVTQMSINAAHDEEFLAALARSGCRGVLIGFESLDEKRAARDAQDLQHHARRLFDRRSPICAGTTSASTALSSSAMTATREESFDEAAAFAIEQSLLSRGLQPPDAVSRHAAVYPPAAAKGGCSTSAGGSTSATATTASRSSRP